MAGQVKIDKLQLGDSATATQNFVLQTNVDGTAKLARGNAGATTQDIMTVDAVGKVAFPQGQSNVGYVTGQGGTVTQITSKSTAVTLDKPVGQIITHNEAIAANTTVYFQVNNNTVTLNDNVLLTMNAATSGDRYNIWVWALAAGSFYIAIRNISGASLSEAIKINFAIIKGATS